MQYITADLHLGHKRMADIRKFADLHTMNKTLINNINDIVKPEDHLIHVGDFCWGDPRPYLAQINCENLHFIIGSHDNKIEKLLDDPVILDLTARGRCNIKTIVTELRLKGVHKLPVIIHHTPLLSWERSHYGSLSFYGHHHLGVADGNTPLADVGKLWADKAKACCVSCDLHGYKPISMQRAIEIADSKPGFLIKKGGS